MSVAGVSTSTAPKSMRPVTSFPVKSTWSCQMSRRQGCCGNAAPASGSSCVSAAGSEPGSVSRNWRASGARSGQCVSTIARERSAVPDRAEFAEALGVAGYGGGLNWR